jgi:oligopeptidase B
MNEPPAPPRAARRGHVSTVHGVRLEDPYAWLRDPNWQAVMRDPERLRPEIRAHLDAENAHTAATLASTESLQEQLFVELRERLKEDDASVPTPDGEWSYYRRFEPGAQHPLFCRRPTAGGDEQPLFDADAASKGLSYFRVAGVFHSPDHRTIARAIDDKGSEFYSVVFRSLDDRGLGARAEPDLPYRLENTSGNVVWANDGKTVFYTVLDEQHRPCKIMRHVLGSDPKDDVLVYEERDAGFFLGLGMTENRGHILIDAHDHTTSEVWLIDANHPSQPPRLVAARERDIEYELSEHEGRFLILTNAGGAEDFQIVEAPIDRCGRDAWREFVPHEPGRLILSVLTFSEHMVRLERENGLPRLVVRRMSDGEEHTISFEPRRDTLEDAYALGLGRGFEYEKNVMRFTYSSMTTPEQTFDYAMSTRTRTLRKVQEVPSGHDPQSYCSARIYADAHDGESIPVSLVWHRDTPIDGTAPLLLYGYGAYGLTLPAGFGTSRLSLVDRGFVYAIAHVRGGKDKGYAWYRHGKLLEKKNSFLDFIAAARALCDRGYTSRGNITAMGGSAGGMLVGAAVNMSPDLFRAVVGQVPFVDVLATMCDAELPLTPPEWPEWGNPLESEEAYRYIASYSPYDNVEAKDYPHILATAGLTDPRVTYWEPAKWVAKLREHKTDDNMLLLRTWMDAGHAGASGRFESLRETALVFAFILLAHGQVPPTQTPTSQPI